MPALTAGRLARKKANCGPVWVALSGAQNEDAPKCAGGVKAVWGALHCVVPAPSRTRTRHVNRAARLFVGSDSVVDCSAEATQPLSHTTLAFAAASCAVGRSFVGCGTRPCVSRSQYREIYLRLRSQKTVRRFLQFSRLHFCTANTYGNPPVFSRSGSQLIGLDQ